ncbi:hypothetical protein BJ875DRAFT_4871 [Amylocarpus encephaloides]|uniref:Uncharacterized protein n=1 Tax=Amylocarpus encephaloides TaxID=45428 RepID=A0A9P7YSC1_9HELO|nr:hypothetical protein BJ875DRAFT_4871 [Amylocarpus encephaloides]
MPDASPPPAATCFSPTPVETTTKKIRRFAPEPVETTCRSSSSKKEDGCHAGAQHEGVGKEEVAPKRRFLPEPVETTLKSRKLRTDPSLPTPEPTPASIPEATPPHETPKPRRRFAPELIETTTRTKKAGDKRPATLPTDKTDLTPGVPNIYTRPKRRSPRPLSPLRGPPENPPAGSAVGSVTLKTSQIPPRAPFRQQSMRPHPNTRRSTRQNSFQPELEDILSSGSDGGYDEGLVESTPSLTGSYGSSDDSNMRLQLARTRESCDDRFSGYLLALAAKAAEKQLREQALAAFPNESNYEIVEHFYDREVEAASDEEVVEGMGMLLDEPRVNGRRKSTEVGWHVKEMQQHQENLNRMREDETNQKIADEATKPTFKDPFWTNGMTQKLASRPEPFDAQKEAELQRMRSAASPPMLGGDLKFRMCPSPKATKFESDQRVDVQPTRCDDGGGLWGGYCVAEEPASVPRHKRLAFIQTPHNELADPFSSVARTNGNHDGVRMLSGIDERLKAEVVKSKAEESLLAEFNDTFITQVYNYLSLGYPSLAQPYDEELTRISQISIADLRADDKTKAKGHIGLVDAPGVDHAKESIPKCARWNALRLYIMEWGRQHPSMSNGAASPSAWGVRARRGSWAI